MIPYQTRGKRCMKIFFSFLLCFIDKYHKEIVAHERENFKRFDKNGDGKLDKKEMVAWVTPGKCLRFRLLKFVHMLLW